MRWLAYVILAYVAVALQIGLGPFLRYKGAQPNLVLLAAVFIALNAPRDAALLGCFCLGLLQDLLTQQPPGLFALSYGLTAMVAVSVHQVIYREHPLTHFSVALFGGPADDDRAAHPRPDPPRGPEGRRFRRRHDACRHPPLGGRRIPPRRLHGRAGAGGAGPAPADAKGVRLPAATAEGPPVVRRRVIQRPW
jgi:hypothetical protein